MNILNIPQFFQICKHFGILILLKRGHTHLTNSFFLLENLFFEVKN